MSFIEQHLSPSEYVIAEASISKTKFFGIYVLAFIGIIGLFTEGWLAGVLFLLIVCTNKRLIVKVGLVGRKIQECPLNKINNITIEEKAIDRLYKRGTLVFQTAANFGSIKLEQISEPLMFKNAVLDAIQQVA